MSTAKEREALARRLGLEMETRRAELDVAVGPQEVTNASVNLAILMNENSEFICWVLKTFGGMTPAPPPINEAEQLPRLPTALLGTQSRVMGASGAAIVAAEK